MAIGRSVPMLDSVARVKGEVDYMVNLRLPNMLVGKIVRSQSPHAKLSKVDTANASQVPGVNAILTREDLDANAFYGAAIKDQGVVAVDRVRYVGEPIAAIASGAETASEEPWLAG